MSNFDYCTIRDVRNALAPSGASDQETAAKLPDWQIEDQINEAEGVVNTYLLSKYTITTVEVEEDDPDNPGNILVSTVAPPPVRAFTRNIAAYLSALVFRKSKDLTEDDPIRLRYAQTMDLLNRIADGKILLPLPPAGSTAQDVEIFNPYTGDLFTLSDVGLGYESQGKQVYWPANQWVI